MSQVATTDPQRIKLSVLEELHRAFDSGLDGASDRQRALLTYLVTEELEGRGDRIKAYSIATEILGRPADFDPQQDSIVRVEVGRLRQALERYYLTQGKNAPVVISIPKGQYRPVFLTTPVEAPPPAPPRRFLAIAGALALLAVALLGAGFWVFSAGPRPGPKPMSRGPVIAIAPFELHADRDGQAFVAGGLQVDLADVLSGYAWLTVVPLGDNDSLISDGAPNGDGARRPDFILRSTLRLIGEDASATVLLLEGRTGAVRWTNRYDFRLRSGEVRAMQQDLVERIGRDLGNPFGVVADIERARRALDESLSDEAFTCHLRAMQYWRNFHSRDFAPAWRCFEALPPAASADATSLAMRAILMLDPLYLELMHRTFDEARTDALSLATRAYELNSFEFVPRAARYLTAVCAGDAETFRSIARDTAERFPNSAIVLADVGARLVTSSDDVQEGLALIARARERAVELTPIDTVAMAIDALRRGDFAARPRLTRFAAQTDDVFVQVAELALAAARGDTEEVARVRRRLAEAGYKNQKQVSQALETSCWSQNLRDLVNAKVTIAFKDAAAHK